MSALPTVVLDPPTISMTFGVNDSPLAGRDGTHVSFFFFFCVLVPSLLPSIACVKFLFEAVQIQTHTWHLFHL